MQFEMLQTKLQHVVLVSYHLAERKSRWRQQQTQPGRPPDQQLFQLEERDVYTLTLFSLVLYMKKKTTFQQV